MGQGNRFAPLIVLIILFIILQALFVAVDNRNSPAKTAKAFIEQYYYLDPNMQEALCAKQRGWAEEYLQARAEEAAQQGYSVDLFRHMFTRMHVQTIRQESDTARVHITGTTRVAINPVFMAVGRLFGLGEDYPVDVTLELIRQMGRWRVCGLPS